MTTTTGVAPASRRSITTTWALPPKSSGAVNQPVNVERSARAALTPITRPNGTTPTSHGTIARAPATKSVTGERVAVGVTVASMGTSGVAPIRWPESPATGVGASGGVDLDGDRHAVGEHVEHCGALP